mmetsp:Transcript_42318/g.84814  ORF Transcript_42318/g.84814 Transcript_42318/m.84814 type:complete len:203 (+) Transcript_42318:178-786(+)
MSGFITQTLSPSSIGDLQDINTPLSQELSYHSANVWTDIQEGNLLDAPFYNDIGETTASDMYCADAFCEAQYTKDAFWADAFCQAQYTTTVKPKASKSKKPRTRKRKMFVDTPTNCLLSDKKSKGKCHGRLDGLSHKCGFVVGTCKKCDRQSAFCRHCQSCFCTDGSRLQSRIAEHRRTVTHRTICQDADCQHCSRPVDSEY